jgi:DNA-binding beta-propeller fold protein YncE
VQSIPRKERQGVVAYRGIKESHPYATVVDPERQRIFVADAAANAILGSTEDGKVETVAVLPPVRVKVTNKLRKSFGLPRCTLGKTFKGEPVPTDVELGPDGKLYVTTLGGALGEQLAVGAVYRVNPATHKARKVESGLRGPVGLAVTPDGTRYVSQLFGGVISQRADGGDMEEFASVPAPGDVEYADGAVYATETGLMSDPQGPPAGQVDRWQVQVVN